MEQTTDIVIIGAGPGAIQLGVSLIENSIKPPNFIMLERNDHAGSFYSTYPVHGTLISNNKLYTGHPAESRFAEKFDWNSLVTKPRKRLMRNYCREFYPKREAVVEMLGDLAKDYDLPIQYNTTCEDVEKLENGTFKVTTNQGTIIARQVVVATGFKPKKADIKGIEHTTPYKDMHKKEFYRDKRVLIIGKGNSGMECAQDILNEANVIMVASRNPARLAYKTHYVGNIRAVNALLVENYLLKHQASLLDGVIREIVPQEGGGFKITIAYAHAEGEVEDIMFDEIVDATGFESNYQSFTSSLDLKTLHTRFPSIDGKFESTEVEGLYFAGCQTHGLDYRCTSSSGFIHGFRYNSIVLANHLLDEYSLNADSLKTIHKDEFEEFIFEELFHDAGIYLQNTFIAIVFKQSADGNSWNNLGYRTLKWFEEHQMTSDRPMVAISLQYGDIHQFEDPLSIPRSPGKPELSVHIHPVIYYRDTENVHRLDLEENLENNFTNTPINEALLAKFLLACETKMPMPMPGKTFTAEHAQL